MNQDRKPHRQLWARIAFAIAIVAVFFIYDSFFTVVEGEAVVVTRFGRPVREIVQAGPYWKIPASIDQVHIVNLRRNIFSTPETTTFTRDKKNIVLSTFVIWHVAEPLIYLQSVGLVEAAETTLSGMVLGAKAQTIGQHDLTALVSTKSEDIQIRQIEEAMTQAVSQRSLSKLGIIVDQVGVERIAFPTENISAVFERMRVERRGEANRLRAEGQKAAQAIRDEAHVRSQEILREGKEKAARITAATEAEISDRLAAVHSRNPDFYRFWSSLQASKRALKERSTLVLSTDQLFFDGLSAPPGERGSVESVEPPSTTLGGVQNRTNP